MEQDLRDIGVPSLAAYWEARYAAAGDSGAGSRGEAAQRKAAYINDLIRRESVRSVVEWGCGDGQQLELLDLPDAYLGVDISPAAVRRCLARHPRRAFAVWPTGVQVDARAEVALSIDVIFHLVADADFDAYWARLFDSATRLVLAHATDVDRTGARHVRHRRHTHLTPDGWTLVERPTDPATPGFYLWQRQ